MPCNGLGYANSIVFLTISIQVAFIAQFPAYYRQVVISCARKSEVDKWSYLFAVVGPPLKLFEKCVRENEHDTAASCLMILQVGGGWWVM